MIIKIIGAGEDHFSSLYAPNENEYIIGVDGGLKVLEKLKLKADLAIGDFDSYNLKDVKAELIKTYNAKKDFSDLALALQYAIKLPHQKIIIYNVTGGRLDHFYSIINELIRYEKYNIEIIDNRNKIFVRKGTFKVTKDVYKYISFFALSETFITLEGFKYPLNKYKLTKEDNLCLSNELINDIGLVTSTMAVLVIQSN